MRKCRVPLHPINRVSLSILKRWAAAWAACAAMCGGSVFASTVISAGGTFTIDASNTTVSGNTTTWNDTGTLTINNGGILQTFPNQNRTVANNDNIVFAGSGGTYTFRFNGNDCDHTINGTISSTATGAQTIDLRTGFNGNGDRESVSINAGIPNVGDGSAMSLNVTFRTQTGSSSWVNLKGANTFTGPITLVASTGPATGYLTIGGTLTQFNGNTFGSGTLGGGNYAGSIALGASTNLNYASSSPQTLSGVISGAGAVQVTGNGALTLSGVNTYTGSTTVSSGKSLVLSNTGGMKFVITDAATNNKITGAGSATLNGIFTVDTSAVTLTSGSWTLVNTTTKSFGGTFGLTGFTGPVSNEFTKTVGGQVWTFNTTTGILSLSSKAIITSFGTLLSTGVINQTTKTIALTVPFGTSLATLAPTFTLTSGTCNQTSGAAPSPTFAVSNPVNYAVTDGAVVNTYVVTVSVTPASSAKDILTADFGVLGLATISGTNILLTVPPGQSLTLAPAFSLSPFATLSPASGSTQNFTSAVNYTVTAQNGTTKVYSVSVQTYETWAHSGSFFIITTPEGANIPAGATETNFPLLLRLNTNNFNFAQAQSDGRDIRFTTSSGAALPYQIEQWDSVAGAAHVWIKIPTIAGNASQEVKMYWGKAGVAAESNGAAVFSASNGYAAVIHMNETVVDSVGTVSPTNSSTTLGSGIIGKGRRFTAGQGINCGPGITGFSNGSNPHSTQCWVKADAANTTAVGWGIEQGQGKVVMQLASPLKVNMDCYFSGGNVTATNTMPISQWNHVVHTYQSGAARLYINGVLDGSTNGGGNMNIPSTANMWIGGWGGGYNFVGDIDEVRISKVVRSANWVKLEYENQKPLQTLVGNLVQPGSTFSVSPGSVTLNENASTTLTGQAGGAQKVYWILKQGGIDTVLAVDQFTLPVNAGRVTGNQSYVIQFKAIYPGSVQTVDIPVNITETIPDPVFTLVPSTTSWDGRTTMTVTPSISNLATLQGLGVANFTYSWKVNGVAVTKQITPGLLTLLRSQGSGPTTVSLTMHNGGSTVTNTTTIQVTEPASDAWVQRTPGATEKVVNNQFIARDDTGFGKVFYNGTQSGSPASVFLKIYTTDTGSDVPYGSTLRQNLVGTNYAFTAPIAAGKFTYKIVYGTTNAGNVDTVVATVTNVVCGDAYIIEGQSNALSTDNTETADPTTDQWLRSYGKTVGWGYAVNKGSELQLGVWGIIQAKRLSTDANMPICIINGAVGGTRIDQHQPNPADHSQAGSLYSIYADLYNRVVGAKLTHGIRAVLWHQGEQNQGSGGPDGDYDYKFYQQYFVDMTAAWKQDFPNIKKYYIFQIWPAACGDTSRNDQLREVQRTLPYLYSNMKCMSTLGINPGSSCHYVKAGYQVFSDLMTPMIQQDFYGRNPAEVTTAPDLKKAYFTNSTRNKISLEFGQNMNWNTGATGLIFLSGEAVPATVSSGSVSGKVIELQLNKASTATTITYVKGLTTWSQSNLLSGTNGISALTFADVVIAPPSPTGLSATPGNAQVALSWTLANGATGYNVKRAAVNGGPYTTIGTTASTSFTDLTAVNGTLYYYVVSATASPAESVDSAQVSATPVAPLSSAKDILTFSFPGQVSSQIVGTNIGVTMPFGTNVSAMVAAFTISPLATASPSLGTPVNFSVINPQTYTITAQDLSTKAYAVTVTFQPAYTTWALAQGLTAGVNDGPLLDPEKDGNVNLLEFVLGGAPLVSSQTILPKLIKTGAVWTFEYDRSDISLSPATVQVVEYGNDLIGWTPITIPTTSAGSVAITPGSPADHVVVTLPNLGGKVMVRLKVTQ